MQSYRQLFITVSGHVDGRLWLADQLNTIHFTSQHGEDALALQAGKRLTDAGLPPSKASSSARLRLNR
jgi:hypothetical protein